MRSKLNLRLRVVLLFFIDKIIPKTVKLTILVLNRSESTEINSGMQQPVCTVASVKCSLRISTPPTLASKPLNHTASNKLMAPRDRPPCGAAGGLIQHTKTQ